MSKTKLELTWIGKDQQPRLEPRILLEDSTKSYGKGSQNLLIHGDNLLALKALEQEFAGKVKCIFIDPPYNTGSAFEHYDDGIEHSLWLSLMRDRLIILKTLLSDNGTIWIAIDDNEAHYLKVLCDEIFGRDCAIANVVWRSSDAPNNDAKTFSIDHNHILVFSRKTGWLSNSLPRSEESNAHYKNPDNDPNGPWFMGNLSSPKPRPNLKYIVKSPTGQEIQPPANGWRWQQSTMMEMISRGEIIFSANGNRLIKKTYLKDQKGLAASTMWDDIEDTGHNRQAKYELKKIFPHIDTSALFATPKPEKLLRKILMIATNPGDLVLDSFLGSGTTAAVAHKMGRRWIGIELGEHCYTHCLPRLQKVVDGQDPGGITEAVGWKGGGGFKFYELAPSLLNKDSFGNFVISPEYNPAMLAAAMAKHEGFRYDPDPVTYWKQGRSTERDYIFTTTQMLTVQEVERIAMDMPSGETLLICCKAYQDGASHVSPFITIKKIPHMLLGRCEFGKEDYSLHIVPAPQEEADGEEYSDVSEGDSTHESTAKAAPAKKAKKGKTKGKDDLSLFDEGE